jgi:hypothetical protein
LGFLTKCVKKLWRSDLLGSDDDEKEETVEGIIGLKEEMLNSEGGENNVEDDELERGCACSSKDGKDAGLSDDDDLAVLAPNFCMECVGK